MLFCHPRIFHKDRFERLESVIKMMVLGQVLPSETDITRLKSIAQTKQKLQAHAICNGVTSFRDKDETKFIFDPYVGGKPFGPYVLRMKFPRYFGLQFPLS